MLQINCDYSFQLVFPAVDVKAAQYEKLVVLVPYLVNDAIMAIKMNLDAFNSISVLIINLFLNIDNFFCVFYFETGFDHLMSNILL